MALKRLTLLFPVLMILITACSKQASSSVAIVAEVTRDGQSIPFTAPTETLDPDAITVIVGTSLPFDAESGTETPIPTETPLEGLPIVPSDEPTFDETTDESAEANPTLSFASPTPFPDVIMFTATPFPSAIPEGAVDSVIDSMGLLTTTPFIQATQPVITPASPLSGDSAIHTPTPLAVETETDLASPINDDEITTIVSTPSAGAGTRPTLNPNSGDDQPETPTTATEVPEECIHTVVRGDTVFKIALANNTTVAAIQAVNPSLNPNIINPGQKIILPNCNATPTPPPATGDNSSDDETTAGAEGEIVYVVRSGDVLGGIARRYGVSVTAIVNRNSLTSPDRLSIGQELIIPASSN